MRFLLLLQRSKNSQLLIAIFVTAILSVYVYTLLRLADKVLFLVVAGYKSTGSYELGVTIFFLASSAYLYLIRNQDWSRTFPFFSTAIALFFPLVVFSSILRINIGLPESLHHFYATDFCDPVVNEDLCGQALAHIVFSMTIRALPLVLTVPLLYRLLFHHLFKTSMVASTDDR